MTLEMNPFYAHDSSVGPVFDVATWSRAKAAGMVVACLIFAILCVTGTVYAWSPDVFLDDPPEVLQDLNTEIADLKRQHPWGAYAGIGVLGLVGLLAVAGTYASLVDLTRGDYYFRAGPGGISFRVPDGLDPAMCFLAFKVLELDVSGDEIGEWVIVQRKQAGATSRDAGAISADLKLKTTDGKRYEFSLDCFREPARIISSKIEDALAMVPADLGPTEPPEAVATTANTETDRFDAIFSALDRLLASENQHAAVVVSDAAGSKFVQFVADGGSLLFDLPALALDESEMLRAVDFFQQMGQEIQAYELRETPDGPATSSGRSFQVRVGSDAATAARLAVEVFNSVYSLSADSPLEVEEQ